MDFRQVFSRDSGTGILLSGLSGDRTVADQTFQQAGLDSWLDPKTDYIALEQRQPDPLWLPFSFPGVCLERSVISSSFGRI